MKQITKFKRLLSGVLSAVMTVSAVPIVSAHADESTEPYPYTMFAASSDDGAITVNAGNFCVNGNVATKGTIVSSGNMNINGTRTENADESMIFIFDKIDNQYFSTSNVDEHDEDYTLDELNININVPTEVQGEATLTGNININNAVKALENVNLYGEVKNTNDSVIFSKYGDIVIESQNVNLNGLVYAPFGSVTINAQNLNLNNVVIIAESIVLTCPNVNANNSSNASSFVGSTSEPLDIPYDEWQYMKDENENDFPDFFENFDNWKLLKDTDGDQLPDCVEQFLGTDATLVDTDGDLLDDYYEVFVTNTDPTLTDTDNNGVTDGNEDFDTDGLTNYQEYVQGTSPWNRDSDLDELSDGDEVNIYNTNPLEPDTDFDGLSDADEIVLGTNPNLADSDGDGTPDNEEKIAQTYVFDVENEDCAVEQVIVSMEGTGNLKKTTSVESMMNKDYLSTNVVGLVGEPFEISTESSFDEATITFKINQDKLNGVPFDNLLFLWYDKDHKTYVELDTILDSTNSTASVITTHFSEYMLVDKDEWFAVWQKELHSGIDVHDPTGIDTILVIDCSGSMYSNDYNEVGRKEAAKSFINSLRSVDKVAILAEDSRPKVLSDFKSASDKAELIKALDGLYSTGGNNFNASLSKCVEMFTSGSHSSHRNIIFMSDGGCTIDDKFLDEVMDANATIFTVGFGSSSWDSTLKHMADYTHGKFYKAITADELVEIYEKIGTERFLNFDDTDKDGLYDIFEQSGMRVQNGQIIHTNYEKLDSDNDGLKDGQEIEPVFTTKTIPYSVTGAEEIVGIQFIMNSNPEDDDDYDKDGYTDYEDPDPLVAPEVLNGAYDFLDGEIYYIAKMVGMWPEDYLDVKNSSTSAGAHLITYNFTGGDNQKFRFEWCDTGYKIHALNNENLVLTLNLNSDNTYSVYMGNDLDEQGQIWEVLPYNNGSEGLLGENGLVIRSKVLYYENEDTIGKPLYISYENSEISVTTDRIHYTRFMTCAIADWTRFGDAYMQYLGWTYNASSDIKRAFLNYWCNNYTGLSSDNLLNYNGVEVLVDQYGGNFPLLSFADVTMDEVCCEVMATYNALVMYDNSNDNYDFFKIAVEFELNALDDSFWKQSGVDVLQFYNVKDVAGLSSMDGGFGCRREKIADCLDSYNIPYISYATEEYDTLLTSSDEAARIAAQKIDYGMLNPVSIDGIQYTTICGIVSYQFDTFHFAAHTFAISPYYGKIKAFNRYSNHTIADCYLTTDPSKTDSDKEIYSSIDSEILSGSHDPRFEMGYLLIKAK